MNTISQKLTLSIILIFSLTGCSDLKNELNKKWPPLTINQQQWIGLENAQTNLKLLNEVDALIFISSDIVIRELENMISTDVPELTNTRITFSNQAGHIETEFRLNLDGEAILEGVAIGGVGLIINPNSIKLLPAFDSIKVTNVINGPWYANEALVSLANKALDDFIKRANSYLDQSPEVTIPLKLDFYERYDMAEMLSMNNEHGKTVGLGEKSLILHTKRFVPNIQEEAIYIALDIEPGEGEIISFQPGTTPESITTDDVSKKSAEFNKEFSKKISNLKLPSDSNGYIIISNSFTSTIVNETFSRISLCGAYSTDDYPSEIPYTPLNPFKGITTTDCSSDLNCELTDAGCEHERVKRDCKKCLSYRPWGGCWLRGIDLVCQLQRDAENAHRALKEVLCKKDRETKAGACNLAKNLENALCDTTNSILDYVKDNGSLGGIEGQLSFRGNAIACLNSFRINTTLDIVSTDFKLGGKADISGKLSFKPEERVGLLRGDKLICLDSWTRDVETNVVIPDQAIPLKASVKFKQDDNSLIAEFTTEEQSTMYHIDPSPVEAIFDENPDLKLICPILGTLTLLEDIMSIVGKGSDDPVFTGDYIHDIPSQTFTVKLESQIIKIGEKEFLTQAEKTKTGILYQLLESKTYSDKSLVSENN